MCHILHTPPPLPLVRVLRSICCQRPDVNHQRPPKQPFCLPRSTLQPLSVLCTVCRLSLITPPPSLGGGGYPHRYNWAQDKGHQTDLPDRSAGSRGRGPRVLFGLFRPCPFISQSAAAAPSLPSRVLGIFPFTRALVHDPVCWARHLGKLGVSPNLLPPPCIPDSLYAPFSSLSQHHNPCLFVCTPVRLPLGTYQICPAFSVQTAAIRVAS